MLSVSATSSTVDEPLPPTRLRWDPPADVPENSDFVDGMVTMLANRDPADLEGVAVHLYRASKSMERRVFVDSRPGAGLRISPHFFNTDEEIDEAINILATLIDK